MSFYTREDFLIYLTENNITTMPEFRKKNPAMVLWYTRHREEIGELPLEAGKRNNTALTEEVCFEIARKYEYRSDLQKDDKGVYLKLLRTGKLDEACAHMTLKPVNYITEHVKNNIIGKPAQNRKDLSGMIFNSWYVIGESKTQFRKHLYWTCHCLGCAGIFEVSGANLRSGASKKCSNCGILDMVKTNTGKVKTKRTPKESSEYYFFIRERGRAIRDGKEWSLSLENVVGLIYKNCTYCGTKPKTKSNLLKNMGLNQKRMEGAVITRNGIDRINSKQGYTIENTTACCQTCNRMKTDHSVADFTAHIAKIAKHLKL